METPPADDCCPICFSDFTVPCRTNCGHWYCSSCILEYWSYGGVALNPCKCPLCASHIKSLTPEESMRLSTERNVVDAMKRIDQYNRLFVGGIYAACLARIREFPLMMSRLGRAMLDPDNLSIMRLVYTLISVYNYDPTGTVLDPELVEEIFNYAALVLVITHTIGLYRRRRLVQRVRRLAALDRWPVHGYTYIASITNGYVRRD